MTGGGFGGCTISLVEASAVENAARALVDGYRAKLGRDAEPYICAPSDGAGFVPL